MEEGIMPHIGLYTTGPRISCTHNYHAVNLLTGQDEYARPKTSYKFPSEGVMPVLYLKARN